MEMPRQSQIEELLLEALKRQAQPGPPAPPDPPRQPPSEDEMFLLSLVPSLQRLLPQRKEPHPRQTHVAGVPCGQLLVTAGQQAAGGCRSEALNQRLSWPGYRHHWSCRSPQHRSPLSNTGKEDYRECPLVVVVLGSRMCRGFQDHMLPIHSATAERKIPPLLKPLCDGPPLLCGGHSHELLHEAIPNSCDYSWNNQGNSGDSNAEAVCNGPDGVTSG
ncbi:hypothetical protein ABVT39_004802 [Epinephelus coioides]